MLSRILLTRHSRAASSVLLSSNSGISSVEQRRRRMMENHEHRSLYRFFHRSSIRMEEELSEKEKKKQMKEKAKAAMAEKERAEEEKGQSKKDDDIKEKAAAAKDAEKDSSSSSSSDSSSSAGDPPPKEMDAAASTSVPGAAPPDAGVSDESIKQYSYPELTADAAKHKAGMRDPTRPEWQNPLHQNNPELEKTFEEDFDSKEEFEKAVVPAPPLADANGKLPAPAHIQELADEVVQLSMLEYNELINKIADHYGFHEGTLAPDDDADVDGDDAEEAAAAPVEAKTKFDVKLVSFDAAAKIKIIKEIRSIVAGLGLKEAKALVESAPVTLQKDMGQEEAEEVKTKLVALGAVIEIA